MVIDKLNPYFKRNGYSLSRDLVHDFVDLKVILLSQGTWVYLKLLGRPAIKIATSDVKAIDAYLTQGVANPDDTDDLVSYLLDNLQDEVFYGRLDDVN